MKAPPPHTRDCDRLPIGEKLAYGAGMLNFHLTSQGIYTLIYLIYNVTLGVDVVFIGIVVSLSRLWDAFTDPVMGKISDNFRSKWGRRRPFILLGGLLTAIFFVAFWHAPIGASIQLLKWYLVISSLLLFTSFTVYSVPYFGLGFEMTPDGVERTRLYSWREIVGRLALFVIPWLYRLAQSDTFPSTIEGIRSISLWVAAIIFLSSAVTAFFCKERYYKGVAERQQATSLLTSVKAALSNRSFMNLVMQFLCMIVGAGLVNVMGQYILIYYVFRGDTVASATMIGVVGTVFAICCLISSAFLVRLLAPMGRVRAIKLLYGVVIFASIAKWFCYDPALPWLAVLPVIIMGLSDPSFWILSDTMVADVCEEDELLHGTRREGVFGAVNSWIKKVAGALLATVSGLIIASTGFNPALGGEQSAETILAMRVLFSVVPILFAIGGLFLIFRYRLTDERVAEIRQTLEARRGTIG